MSQNPKYPERQKIELVDFPGFESRKRRRRRVPGTDERKNADTICQWTVRGAILAMVTIAPWCYGSVSQTARLLLFGCSAVALTAWWVNLLLTRFQTPPAASVPNRRVPWLALPVLLGLILLACQTIPLEENASEILAQRQLELFHEFGTPVIEEVTSTPTEPPSVTTSMNAHETGRYVRLLFLALVTLVCSSYFFDSQKSIIAFLVLTAFNAVAISGLGFAQRASRGTSQMIFHSRDGIAPFGPFVNANNAAGYLLLGLACAVALLVFQYRGSKKMRAHQTNMIARNPKLLERAWFHLRIFVSELDAPKLSAIVATLIIAAGIISTGSRGAFLGLIAGVFFAASFYSLKYRSFTAILCILLVAVGAISLVQFIGLKDTVSTELSTLSEADVLDTESRVQHWEENTESIYDFLPMGSGIGSYLHVHRMNRTGEEKGVWYFAENQYFQTLLEAGFLGITLLLVAIGLLGLSWNRIATFQGETKMAPCIAILGAVLIPSQVLAAIFDFGLFIPANTLLMAAICGILVGYAQTLDPNDVKKPVEQRPIPSQSRASMAMIAMVLIAFCVNWIGLTKTLQEARVESLTPEQPLLATPASLLASKTDQQIESLTALLNDSSSASAWNTLAHLLIHRYRLDVFEKIELSLGGMPESGRTSLDLWATTQPAFVNDFQNIDSRNIVLDQNSDISRMGWKNYHQALVNKYFQPAIYCLQQSRRKSPLQAEVHLLLGQLSQAFRPAQTNQWPHFQRAMKLAPGNAAIVFAFATAQLNAKQLTEASESFKRFLTLEPSGLDKMAIATIGRIPKADIFSDVLPKNPSLIERFGIKYLQGEANRISRIASFRQAADLLGKPTDQPLLNQKLRLQIASQDIQAALTTNRELVRLFPNDLGAKVKLIQLLLKDGNLDEAFDLVSEVRNRSSQTRRLYDRVVRELNKQQPK